MFFKIFGGNCPVVTPLVANLREVTVVSLKSI